jgi:DNA-directed RNA polymerase specialized sigma24 family protein
MATLDQLPPEQRAIVELVVQRGRSYETLAEVLQVPQARVRELAREALTELSPRTAARVDVDRRAQVADYLMRQQSPDEERATRDYLKESEPARAWALSLLDSLDPLYANGAAPSVPEPAAAVETAEDRIRARERERAGKTAAVVAEPEPEAEAAAEEEAEVEEKEKKKPERAALSPEAEAALKRRRILGGVAGLAILAGIVVGILAIAGVFDSGKKKSSSSSSSTSTTASSTTPSGTTPGQAPVQVVGGIALSPIGKNNKSQGVAYIVQQGSQRYVVIQAKVPPLPNNQKVAAYEVWLYNSNRDARSLGAQYTNAQGVLQGRAPLPADVGKFKSIDISRELFADKNAGHSNNSLLRGDFSSIKPVQQQPGGASTTPGATPTTPTAPGTTTPAP